MSSVLDNLNLVYRQFPFGDISDTLSQTFMQRADLNKTLQMTASVAIKAFSLYLMFSGTTTLLGVALNIGKGGHLLSVVSGVAKCILGHDLSLLGHKLKPRGIPIIDVRRSIFSSEKDIFWDRSLFFGPVNRFLNQFSTN
ncbi:MAG: hypothetical protein Tsb0021_08920 [Chlamydiales bacterium]